MEWHFGICKRNSQRSGVSGYNGETFVAKYFPSEDFIFQDDNAPVHRARCIVKYKLRNKIKSLSWPAQSPNINIIENIWLRLKNALQRNINAITSVDELRTAITTAWN